MLTGFAGMGFSSTSGSVADSTSGLGFLATGFSCALRSTEGAA